MAFLLTSVVDTNSTTTKLTGDNKVLIKYHSTAEASMELANAEADASLSLDASVIDNGDNRVYGVSATFPNVEDELFKFGTIDSYNRSWSANHTAQMIDYVRLTCNITSITIDGDNNATVVCNGNYFNDSFGAEDNSISVQCTYYDDGNHGVQMDVTTNGNTYTASVTFTVTDYRQRYTINVSARDKLERVTDTGTGMGVPNFHWGKDDFAFETPVEAKQGIRIGENIRLSDGSANYLRFGDGNYCSIAELSDDEMTIKANDIILETNDHNSDSVTGSLKFGTWTPELYDRAIDYYTAQEGWYSKIGNAVTVGFYIKANCNENYEDETIVITGLPYTPLYSAAGGGMCSGACVSGGYNFQCYVAETNSTITTRVQQCNKTSASNLSTSASGCNYKEDGGEITLSGTIIYTTEE